MKQLRKDDGYVLVYVLIVFTILSAVAVSICSGALRNLQAQKADVVRMEARYAAEGVLQQFVAQVEALEAESGDFSSEEATHEIQKSAAEKAARSSFWGEVAGLDNPDSDDPHDPDDILKVDLNDPASNASVTNVVTITAQAKKGGYSATITATAEISVTTSPSTTSVDGTTTVKATCVLAENGWKYTSYDISYEEVPDDEA